MKKTLSVLAVLGIAAIIGTQAADAFCWSKMNPFRKNCRPNCEQKKPDSCPVKTQECPCPTGMAAPCNPCQKEIVKPKTCEPCDRLQQEMAK